MATDCRCRHLISGHTRHIIDGLEIDLCPMCDRVVTFLVCEKSSPLSLIESLAVQGLLDLPVSSRAAPVSPDAAIPTPDDIAMMVDGLYEVPVEDEHESGEEQDSESLWLDELLPAELLES